MSLLGRSYFVLTLCSLASEALNLCVLVRRRYHKLLVFNRKSELNSKQAVQYKLTRVCVSVALGCDGFAPFVWKLVVWQMVPGSGNKTAETSHIRSILVPSLHCVEYRIASHR